MKVTDEMVNRFLGWKLPEDFHPDAGISFTPFFNVEWNAKQGKPPERHQPVGTNLFTADQARAMLEYVLAAAPSSVATTDMTESGWTPEQALRFYADGKHFDVVDGRTRILDTGAVASDALKGLSAEYAANKGVAASSIGESDFEAWFKSIPDTGFPTIDAERLRIKEPLRVAWKAALRSVAVSATGVTMPEQASMTAQEVLCDCMFDTNWREESPHVQAKCRSEAVDLYNALRTALDMAASDGTAKGV